MSVPRAQRRRAPSGPGDRLAATIVGEGHNADVDTLQEPDVDRPRGVSGVWLGGERPPVRVARRWGMVMPT